MNCPFKEANSVYQGNSLTNSLLREKLYCHAFKIECVGEEICPLVKK